MNTRTGLVHVISWLCGSLGLFGATFTTFPSLVILYPGETKHLRITSDVKGKLSAMVNSGSPAPVSVSPNPTVASNANSVDVAITAADSVSSATSGGRSVTVSVTPAGQTQAQTGSVSFSFFVLPGVTTHAQNPDSADCGDPVSTRTGEFYGLEKTDLDLGGPMPLKFARYYASRLAIDARTQTSLGANRLHHFETRLVYPGARHADIITNRGRVITFEMGTKGWKLIRPLDVPYQLVAAGPNVVLGDPLSHCMWTYNATTGRLLKIEDGKGNAHSLIYNAAPPIRLQQVADGLGRTLDFTYDGTGRLIRLTDHTGRHVDFVTNGSVLGSAKDPLGHTTVFTHAGNLMTSYQHPQGNTPFTQSYTLSRVTSQTERGTDTSTVAYAGLSTTFAEPATATIADAYDTAGELLTRTDQSGNAITLAYDAAGRRTSVMDRAGDVTFISYHAASGKPDLVTTAEGRTMRMTYKARLLNGLTFYDLIKVVLPDASAQSYAYDSRGNLTQFTDQAGKLRKFTYNGRGQVLTSINPLGGISTFTYDIAGNLISRADPDTQTTQFEYDALNRLTKITRPGPAEATISYDAADRISSITDERGQSYGLVYDSNGRLTMLTDPGGEVTSFTYDSLDRLTQVTDRVGAARSVTFDSRRLLASFSDGNGHKTDFQHDSRHRLEAIVDPDGKIWPRGYDAEGQLISASTPIDAPGSVKRNRLGAPVEISDALGNTVVLKRDAMQRVIQRFDPLGRAATFTYDKRGLLATAVEQGTGVAKFDRDGLGAVTKMTDPNGGTWSFAFTKGGRLASMTDPLGKKTVHAYDARGRRSVTTFADGVTENRTYDAASNLTRRLFSDGTDILSSYDNLNRLIATNGLALSYDAEGRVTNTDQGGVHFGAEYDTGGRLTSVTYNNDAVTVTYVHDSRNRMTRVSDSLSGAQIDFSYDDAGRLAGMTRSNGVNGTFTHDAAGRLRRIQEQGPEMVLDLDSELNAAGEVAAMNFQAPLVPGAGAAGSLIAKVNKASQIANPGFVYDVRGRLAASPNRTYGWDGATRLTNANGVTMTYNGCDDLLTREAGGATTRFYYNHAVNLHPIMAERVEGGAFVRYYVWSPEGRLLYSIDAASGAPTFYHFDRIGSTLALSSASGTVTDSYAYGPYGEAAGRTGGSTQPFTYVGAWGVRVEGDLYHMRARYYDPATAKFLSRDAAPISLRTPKRLNVYEYAAQNPLAFIDPEGRDELPAEPSDWEVLNAPIPGLAYFELTQYFFPQNAHHLNRIETIEGRYRFIEERRANQKPQTNGDPPPIAKPPAPCRATRFLHLHGIPILLPSPEMIEEIRREEDSILNEIDEVIVIC